MLCARPAAAQHKAARESLRIFFKLQQNEIDFAARCKFISVNLAHRAFWVVQACFVLRFAEHIMRIGSTEKIKDKMMSLIYTTIFER